MDLLVGSFPYLLSTTAIALFAAAALARLLFFLAVALAFVPQWKQRMLKLIKVAAPLIRKSGLIGTRRLHERIAVPPLMFLAMIPATAKTARQILATLNT
ncbi:hypothetical protein [Microbacterium sp. LWH3-1.2]|uniref:hypothetical protein n=1 Tax=Microbacterium sp. LWH3-1.2 TaxID=3135256 RepID=UPI00341C84E7